MTDSFCSLPYPLPLLAGDELHAETVGIEFRPQTLNKAWLYIQFQPLLLGICGDRMYVLRYSRYGSAVPDGVPPYLAPFHLKRK